MNSFDGNRPIVFQNNSFVGNGPNRGNYTLHTFTIFKENIYFVLVEIAQTCSVVQGRHSLRNGILIFQHVIYRKVKGIYFFLFHQWDFVY